MSTFGKILQAVGLTIVGIGFIADFPKLINTKSLISGLFFFATGWLIERFLIK
ncbi:MAG: hypothetical protein V3U16_07455 [Candidatus Neomarinimicrobiota bacterium]